MGTVFFDTSPKRETCIPLTLPDGREMVLRLVLSRRRQYVDDWGREHDIMHLGAYVSDADMPYIGVWEAKKPWRLDTVRQCGIDSWASSSVRHELAVMDEKKAPLAVFSLDFESLQWTRVQ